MFDASRCRPDLERPRSFAYGKHDLHLGPASRPPDRTWGHSWYTMGLPKAHGPQSIQIEGLRVPYVLLQTAGDQDGL
eukprot:scaffold7205_cov46-Phaeocystis_antarctica.AAC.1